MRARNLVSSSCLGLCLTACFDPSGVDETDTEASTGSGSDTTGPTSAGPGQTQTLSDPTVDPDSTGDPTTPPLTTTSDTTDGDTTAGPCTAEGCPCTGEGQCDADLACVDMVCTAPVCGNEAIEGDEQCDDGNATDGDGCDMDCTYTEITIDVAYQNTCALIEGGRVRCWGVNSQGELGYGNTDNLGDNETPASVGDLMLPGPVFSVASGDQHTCARMGTGTEFICWGVGSGGRLGYGNTNTIGDNEFPSTLGPVDVGGDVQHVTVGGSHSCAITVAGTVTCWGVGGAQLGYGNNNSIGDNELPAAAGSVNIGAAINDVSAGIGHTCAIQSNGAVRCWGNAFSGQLGYGNTNAIGDDETPAAAPGAPLDFGDDAIEVGAGLNHTCALLNNGDVRCWGANESGQAGVGDTTPIGSTVPATMGVPADLGAPAVDIAVGDNHTCALLDNGEFRCWGSNNAGELGLGNTNSLGDDELPSSVDAVMLDGEVIQFDAGGAHTCVVLDDYRVRCWGANNGGQLGTADTAPVGDNELPLDVSPIMVL